MYYEPGYDFIDEADRTYADYDYPWIEFSISGTKYDINSKYLYDTPCGDFNG